MIIKYFHMFYGPRIEWSGGILFCPVCLSVCLFVYLSVVTFNIRYNFWTVRDRDIIFGMHTPLMMPFQNDIKVNDLDFDLCAKK